MNFFNFCHSRWEYGKREVHQLSLNHKLLPQPVCKRFPVWRPQQGTWGPPRVQRGKRQIRRQSGASRARRRIAHFRRTCRTKPGERSLIRLFTLRENPKKYPTIWAFLSYDFLMFPLKVEGSNPVSPLEKDKYKLSLTAMVDNVKSCSLCTTIKINCSYKFK